MERLFWRSCLLQLHINHDAFWERERRHPDHASLCLRRNHGRWFSEFFYHVKRKGQTWKYCHSPLKKFIKWTKEQHPGLLKYRWIKMPHCIIIPSRLFHSHSHPLTAEWRFIWKTKPPACSCWKLFPVAEKHIMNVFGTSRFSSKVLLYRMINWFTATTPATSLTECRWKG